MDVMLWVVTQYTYNMDVELSTEIFDTAEAALEYLERNPDTKDHFYSMRRLMKEQ